jgi:hypothetical protein
MPENAYSVRRVSNEEAHRLAREKGVSRFLYGVVRGVVSPLFRLYFRMHISGADCIPAEGAAIVAPNQHVHFMAKTELIQARRTRRRP